MYNLTKIEQQSLVLLGKRMIPNVVWFVLGLVGMVTNTIVFLVFIRYKPLKSKCGFTMTHLAVSDFLLCAAHFWHAVRELNQYALAAPRTLGVQYCWYLDMGLQMLTSNLNRYIALALSFDRMFAAMAPIWYRGLEIKYSICVNIFCWLWTLLPHLTFGFFALYSEKEKPQIPICDTSLILQRWFLKPWGYYTWAVSLWMLLTYGIVWTVIIIRFNKAKRANTNLKDVKELVEYKTVKTMTIVIGMYIFCSFLVSGIVSNGRQAGTVDMAILVPSVKTLWIFNSATNLFVYGLTFETFRTGFKTIYGKSWLGRWILKANTTTVAPAPLTRMPTRTLNSTPK